MDSPEPVKVRACRSASTDIFTSPGAVDRTRIPVRQREYGEGSSPGLVLISTSSPVRAFAHSSRESTLPETSTSPGSAEQRTTSCD